MARPYTFAPEGMKRSHSVNLRLSDEVYEKLVLLAGRRRWSKSYAASYLIELALSDEPPDVFPQDSLPGF